MNQFPGLTFFAQGLQGHHLPGYFPQFFYLVVGKGWQKPGIMPEHVN
jgi:hypothetical protein